MIPGIKVGPRTWKTILKDYHPQVCEVWFRIDWVDRYKAMFAFLRREKIPTGLHFWGILPGGIAPNFAFSDREIRDPSVELAKRTIDVASAHEFRYVNIHPGSYRLTRIDFDRECMRPVSGRETTSQEGNAVLFENTSLLHEYAQKRGVLFLVETIPAKEPMHWRDLVKGRLRTQDMRNVPVSVVEDLAAKGFFVCNDFMHTAMDVISDDRTYLFDQLFNTSKRLTRQTRLIHVNTMPPPFNGTDGHLGILKKDFAEDVFPSREQLKSLLSLFVDRDDVWAIPEPFSNHAENTKALEVMLEEISVKG
ncbi:TIM barrel protein [Patescibacteria group bacterium]|nr:TIM barrel protein [Patescibacteria group bacterium]